MLHAALSAAVSCRERRRVCRWLSAVQWKPAPARIDTTSIGAARRVARMKPWECDGWRPCRTSAAQIADGGRTTSPPPTSARALGLHRPLAKPDQGPIRVGSARPPEAAFGTWGMAAAGVRADGSDLVI